MIIQTIIYVLFLSLVYLLIAKGFELVYRTSGVFNIVYALSLSVAAYIAFSLESFLNVSLVVTIPLSVFATTVIMTAIERLLLRPLIHHCNVGWQTMVVTLAFYYVLLNCIKLIWGDNNLSFLQWQENYSVFVRDFRFSPVHIIAIAICSLLLAGFDFICDKTLLGKRIRACSLNSELCPIIGVDRDSTITHAYIIGCVMASIAGLCIAADTQIYPNMGFNWFFLGVVAMIIGGMGKTRHLVFGALLLAAAQHLSAYFFDSKWMNATAYIILVVFLYFRPYGFSGKKLKKTEI